MNYGQLRVYERSELSTPAAFLAAFRLANFSSSVAPVFGDFTSAVFGDDAGALAATGAAALAGVAAATGAAAFFSAFGATAAATGLAAAAFFGSATFLVSFLAAVFDGALILIVGDVFSMWVQSLIDPYIFVIEQI
jgi:hypothetical protein